MPTGTSCPVTALWLGAGSPDTKAEGLEGQINRLAELIGRLEDKVRARVPAAPPASLPRSGRRSPRHGHACGTHRPWVGAGLLLVVEDLTGAELTAAVECGMMNWEFI